jgi:hypothetical protein
MKSFQIIFNEKAIADTIDAFDYYENISAGLGKKFPVQVQVALLTIRRNPFPDLSLLVRWK